MIAMRARSWAIRDGAADALMGLSIADEGDNIGPDKARDVTPAPRAGGVVYAPPEELREPDEIIDAPVMTDEDRDRIAAEVRAQTQAMAGGAG